MMTIPCPACQNTEIHTFAKQYYICCLGRFEEGLSYIGQRIKSVIEALDSFPILNPFTEKNNTDGDNRKYSSLYLFSCIRL